MEKYSFNAEQVANDLIQWTKDWFAQNGANANVVVGMSGGKDSTVAAAILCKALGAGRVIGVAMPDVESGQGLNDADKICEYLGIKFLNVSVSAGCKGVSESVKAAGIELSQQSEQNIPPRIRMTTLYAIGQAMNGRVVNTCNLSEDYIGYATKFGDGAGDFSLFAHLTVTEVLAIGDYLGLPYEWVHKTPDDGLPHSSSDEKKIGFLYAELDKFIREGIAPEGHCHDNPEEPTKLEKIQNMHRWNLHKIQPMPAFMNK